MRDLEFNNKFLIRMTLPIMAEQFLALLVGIADTLMISYAGEAAVSGVSLVSQLDNVFIMAFMAIATGGAVIASQYMGIKDRQNGSAAASQLVMITAIVGMATTVILIILSRQVFNLLFGHVETDVMEQGILYLRISACSFTGIAVYNACASLYRSMGKTGTVMLVSMFMNVINISGNAIGIFILHAGVKGVAIPSLIARTIAAIIMLVLISLKSNTIHITTKELFRWNSDMLKRIFRIAVPGGIEESMFHITKVALTTMTALFGTSQIAAYGIAQSFWNLASLSAFAMSPVFIAVVGRHMGAGDTDGAVKYNIKLVKMTYVLGVIWNATFALLSPLIISLYDLTPETSHLVLKMIVIYNILYAILGPLAFSLSSGLRAAGDVKFTLYASIFATVICRIVLAFIFAVLLGWGVMGILFAMVCDWVIKGALIVGRFRGGKWKLHKVI